MSSKLIGLLNEHLRANGVSKEEFIEALVRGDWGDRPTATKVMNEQAEPCVGVVTAAQEVLALSDEEAARLELAGRQDARENTYGKRIEGDDAQAS